MDVRVILAASFIISLMIFPAADIALVANGVVNDYEWLTHRLRPHPRVIAVDGGLHHCHRVDIEPHGIVGDLDSVDASVLAEYPNIPTSQYPRDKDQTDLELAVEEYIKDAGTLIVYGALGQRTDHLLCNLQLLCRYPQRLFFESECELLFAVGEDLDIPTSPGQVLSLLPIGAPATDVTTQGLRWELKTATLSKNFVSLANECTGEKLSVHVGSGDLICCIPYGTDPIL